MRLFFILMLFIVSTVTVNAQNYGDLPSDIPEEEIKAKLIEKGYDPENIDPDELEEFQEAAEEVVAQLKKEKEQQAKNDTDDIVQESVQEVVEGMDNNIPTKENISDIEEIEDLKEEIDNGASLEEALGEKVSEQLIEDADYVHIYGHNIFKNSELKLFRTTDSNITPPNYVLSSGDEIVISIFGRSQVDFSYTINKNGYISPQRVGKIYLKGMKYEDAETLLRKRFSKRYSFMPEQFRLTLKSARTISVAIYGEVVKPGTYNISALNNALNAILAAGGPRPTGSVRNIKLRKVSGEVINIDVYKYLTDPTSISNLTLDNNDVIQVPIIEKVVTISGAIKRAMKYELLDTDNLSDLIEYAGGPGLGANVDLIKVTRVTSTGSKVYDVSSLQSPSFMLKHGDGIRLRKSNLKIKEFVEIQGAVEYSGEFEYKKGLTLAELLKKGVLSRKAKKDFVFIYRRGNTDLLSLLKIDLKKQSLESVKLQPFDKVVVLTQKTFKDFPREISITGAVRNPLSVAFENDIKLDELIILAGGLKENAYTEALVTRYDRKNRQWINYKKVDVFNAVNNPTSIDNLQLREGDRVRIYLNEYFNDTAYEVSIVGDVKNPTSVPYDDTISLKDLLFMSGGLSRSASSKAILKRRPVDNNIDVTYEEIDIRNVLEGNDDYILQPRDQVIVYNKNQYRQKFNVKVEGEVNNPGEYDYDGTLTLNNLIYMSGGLTPKAAGNNVNIYRIEFRDNKSNLVLHKRLSIIEDEYGNVVPSENVVIAPYDIIIIRPIPNYKLQQVVYVRGEVMYPGPYIIDDNYKLASLVEAAGGLTDRAFPLGATLERKRGPKKGSILINLKDALRFGKKHENIPLLPEDVLTIPRKEKIVSIKIKATKATKEYTDSLLVNKSLQIAYQGKKSAKWYVDNFAGGFAKNIDKKTVRVIEPNGRIRGSKKILWFYDYPTVTEGSTVAVDYNKPNDEEEVVDKPRFNLSDSLKEILAITSSAVTIIALARTINQ